MRRGQPAPETLLGERGDTHDLPAARLSLFPIEKGWVSRPADQDRIPHENPAASLSLTRNLMALAAAHHLPGVINASSQSVYGLSRPPPWHEEMPPIPETPYAQAKWASELMAMMPRQINHVTTATSLRFAQLTGLGTDMRWDELPHLFIKQALAGERITVQGGQQILDYLHVRDAARLIALLCMHPFDEWPAVVNAGSGSPISLAAFATLVSKTTHDILGKYALVDTLPASVDLKKGMAVGLARETLGWEPKIGMEETLREIAHHLLKETPDRPRTPIR